MSSGPHKSTRRRASDIRPSLDSLEAFCVIAATLHPVLAHLRVSKAKRRRRRQLQGAQNKLRTCVFSFSPRCYHSALLESGVKGYDRTALTEDYRLAVLWQITTPIWQAMLNIPPLVWWNNLERIFLAVDDLNCQELLD
jgi:hypothetical protein